MYKTKQNTILLDFFKNNSTRQYSIEQLAAYPEIFDYMGKSTIYRIVGKLVEAGDLKRITATNSRKIVYQYSAPAKECKRHMHLRCNECGETFHLDNLISNKIRKEIQKNYSFEANNFQTIIYGKCNICNSKSNQGVVP